MQNVLTIARIVFTDERSVVVAITRVGEVTPEDSTFSFMVLESSEQISDPIRSESYDHAA